MILRQIREISPRKAWQLWFGLAGVALAIQAMTISVSPTVWQDEVQIVEYGRTALPGGDPDWSMNWSAQGRPIQSFCYLGCGLQDVACRLSGLTEVGPRLASMLGAIFAGTALLGWFLSRGIRPLPALASALLLLLDPVFAQSYRGARVDCWVFGFMFLACLLIWQAAAMPPRGGCRRMNLFLTAGGVSLALAGLCWASAILMVPLVMHEYVSAFKVRFTRGRMTPMLCGLLILGGSALVTVLLLLTPMWHSVMTSLQDLSNGVSSASSVPSAGLSSLGIIAESYRLSPWLLLLGLGSFFIQGNRLLGGAFLLALVGVCATHAYIHRALYLLPYLLLGISGGMAFLTQPEPTRPIHLRAALVCLGLLLCWSATLTLGMRTWTALHQRESRSQERLMNVAMGSIGKRAGSVYTRGWEFYYVGRRLEWRLFNLRDMNMTSVSGASSNFLSQIDYAILRVGEPDTPPTQQVLEHNGFKLVRSTQVGGDRRVAGHAGGGYGEYLIYASGTLANQD